MTTHQIIYLSRFREKPTEEQLTQLLHQARSKNHRLLITGILLYADGRVLQVLEGQEAAVRAVYSAITSDKRHHQLVTLVDTTVPQRVFPDWSMGFTVADSAEYERLTGYVNPEKPLFPLPRAHNASPALMQLLRNFVALHPVLA
ncbi:BLUF domain-containing protein [Hymenobacter taeanensis]|uniref:BLUF domain-containing protein n=1 Tax=Hymenobacter taeanensis TaxID=2735321 RepID=A0A6M6BLS5_9BACT|nr:MULTISPECIES: BLUF domain-containing protein [Hymenobacter]QJX48055.1 BLUF domain-containing protein [Hymenobacter taeanensis]UOQ82492.1 BLUF domain-containing protein [Hymenobacter sp. 5414T-23]